MMRNYPRLLPYGLAIGSTAIALLLRLWLESLLSETVGGCFYIAILITTWYGGYHAGLVSLVLSAVAIKYFFFYPRYELWIFQPQSLLQLCIFLLVGLIINRLTSKFLSSKQKIQQLSQQLAQENAEQLRMALSGAHMGMWDWNLVTGEVKWSPETEQLFGLAIGTYNGRSETFEACLHPEDRQAVKQTVEQALQTHSIYQCEYRIIWADGSIHWLEGRGQGFYNAAGEPVRMSGTVMAIDDRKQAQITLEQQFAQQRLVMDMTVRIRRSLNLQDILQTTVDEVRQFLLCDRVTIFQFSPDWSGTVVVESVGANWTAMLSTQIFDPCISKDYVEPFKAGLVTAKSDIYTADIDSCHVQLLAKYQVRANLVVPILHREELWGLLIAHHCEAPRSWQTSEIELVRQIATQVSIAIQQADLYAQVQTELTERKQIEAALRQSEQRYRSLVHASAQIVWLTDADGMTTVVPEVWEQLSGQSIAQSLGLGWLDFVHPDDRDRALLKWQESYTNRTLYKTEYRLRMKDGNYRDFAVRGVPILAADGNISEWIGTCTDITERKQAEIALQQLNAELEQRVAERTAQLAEVNDRLLSKVIEQQQTQIILLEQSQLLDLAHDTIMTLDLNLRITFWNEGAENMYGFAKTEALGQISHVLLQTQFPQPRAEIEAQLLETGYWEGELIHFRRDARLITVASRWVLQKDNAGKPIKILEINNDITERKQAEFALSQSEERRRLALDLTHTAFWDWHLPSTDMVWNDNHFTLLGLAPYSIEPCYEVWHNAIHPEDVAVVEQEFLESIASHSDYITEYRVVHPDGSVHWLMGRGRAIYDESGQALRSLGVLLDISDRKRAEAILRQYERIVSSTKDGIALVNSNYIYQIVNQGYLDWCNKPDTEVLGKSKRDVLGERLFDSVIQSRLNRCLAGETIQYEQWFDYPNPVPRFISVTYTPYREADGRISGAIVSMRDLTQLKQAQQMLELQAVITRNMAEGICLVRADNGIIVYANPKFEQMFGYDSGELNSQHVSIVNYGNESVNPEDVNQAIRSTVLQKGEATYEVHNVKKDGTPFWCSATCSFFSHPDYGDVLVAVHQDITDRKNIENALRQSEEKFRQLADNIQAVFWMKDIQNQQVIYVSKAYEIIWQSSCERVYQNFADWLDAIHPEDRRLVDLAFSEQLKTGYSDTKYRIIRPDGFIRWIRDRAFPIKNETGEITRIAGIAEDITELQKVEQIKSEFIGIVSHELRTPLTAIRAALGLLNSGVYDNRPDKFKRMINIAATDCDRLVRLVNDILDLERLESGRAVLDKTTCEAADLIQQAVEGVKAIAKQQNISFNIDITDAQVWADADAIIQTLTNLLSNALKFSPSDSTITLSVQPQTDCVLFQISDQGRGIPTEKLEVIFGRFQQVDASDSRDKGGTGLGLAICHSIIDQHNGKIWAESTLGVGSTFFFTLPLSRR